MSGSSHAEYVFSRCVVSLDAGISISWARGSAEAGQRHHRDEQTRFSGKLERATASIEVVFDELEQAGHVFIAPKQAGFSKGQRGSTRGLPICEVRLACAPRLTKAALDALVERVAALVQK